MNTGLGQLHETFLNAEKTGPLPVVEHSCLLAHSTRGRRYSVAEIEALLLEAGPEMIDHRETGGDQSVIPAQAKRAGYCIHPEEILSESSH